MQHLVIEGIALNFIHNRRLKNSYISIDKAGEVTLKSPNAKEQFLSRIVLEKRAWILKKQQHIVENRLPEEVLGESIYFMGTLQPIRNFSELELKINTLTEPSEVKIETFYNAFLKKEARLYISERLESYAKKMQLEYSGVRFRKMKRRWGSCDTKKVITFNSRLIRLEVDMIDYVVVHELAHLVHMNHSKAFHELVRISLPNADSIHSLLKETTIT